MTPDQIGVNHRFHLRRDRAMTDTIYRGYNREELDLQYTNLTTEEAKADAAALQEHAARNVAELNPERGVSYAGGGAQVFDIYRAGKGAPAMIYISGGQWQNGGPGKFCSWADSVVARGVTFIDGGFPQIPDARLPEIVDSIVILIRHIRANGEKLGIDPANILVTGHSSGAHLAAMALVRMANADDLEDISGCYLMSGHYDVRPAMLCYRKEYLQLSVAETIAMSPLLNLVNPLPPTMVAIGGGETDEMLRQSSSFAESLAAIGPAELRGVPDANHFSVADDLATEGTPSWNFVGERLGLG